MLYTLPNRNNQHTVHKISSFDPVQKLIELIHRNLMLLTTVHCYHCAKTNAHKYCHTSLKHHFINIIRN